MANYSVSPTGLTESEQHLPFLAEALKVPVLRRATEALYGLDKKLQTANVNPNAFVDVLQLNLNGSVPDNTPALDRLTDEEQAVYFLLHALGYNPFLATLEEIEPAFSGRGSGVYRRTTGYAIRVLAAGANVDRSA